MKTSKTAVLLLLLLLAAAPLFAQDVIPAGMATLAGRVLSAMTGTFVRTILAIFLCGSAIAYAFNKDNEKVKRSAIAIGIAAAILIGAQEIVNQIWNASGGSGGG